MSCYPLSIIIIITHNVIIIIIIIIITIITIIIIIVIMNFFLLFCEILLKLNFRFWLEKEIIMIINRNFRKSLISWKQSYSK